MPKLSENRSCSARQGSLSSARLSACAGGLAARESTRLVWPVRLLLICVAVGLVTLLGIAGSLEPDARGFGTHQQLGMPECTFLSLCGYPCPSCGMTTSWAYLVRGELVSAVWTNAGGALLGLAAMMAVPWALLSAVGGRLIAERRIPMLILVGTALVLVAAVGPWLGKMAAG